MTSADKRARATIYADAILQWSQGMNYRQALIENLELFAAECVAAERAKWEAERSTGEPVACKHEWYQGKCVHCEITPTEYRAHPLPSDSVAVPRDDDKTRLLRAWIRAAIVSQRSNVGTDWTNMIAETEAMLLAAKP